MNDLTLLLNNVTKTRHTNVLHIATVNIHPRHVRFFSKFERHQIFIQICHRTIVTNNLLHATVRKSLHFLKCLFVIFIQPGASTPSYDIVGIGTSVLMFIKISPCFVQTPYLLDSIVWIAMYLFKRFFLIAVNTNLSTRCYYVICSLTMFAFFLTSRFSLPLHTQLSNLPFSTH